MFMEVVRREQERLALRVGAVLGVLGGVGYFIALLVHGDLPDHTTAAALEHIAGRPGWSLLKLSLIVFVLCWVGAFTALTTSLYRDAAWLLSRLALTVLIIGAVLVLVEYSILGYGLKNVADSWAAASGPDRGIQLEVGRALVAVASGLFLSFISWLLGLPFLLMGLAVLHDEGYPNPLGWVAVGAGGGALVSGATRFLGWPIVPMRLLYGAFVVPLCLWLATMGVVMWRKAR